MMGNIVRHTGQSNSPSSTWQLKSSTEMPSCAALDTASVERSTEVLLNGASSKGPLQVGQRSSLANLVHICSPVVFTLVGGRQVHFCYRVWPNRSLTR